MKKRLLFIVALCLCFVTLLCTTIFAEAQLDYVTDDIGVLTYSELDELNDLAEDLSTELDFGIYALVVDDYLYYGDSSIIFEVAKEIYSDYDLGMGENRDGVLLLLSTEDRDYSIYASAFGSKVFSNSKIDILEDSFLGNLKDDDWSGAIESYIFTAYNMTDTALSNVGEDGVYEEEGDYGTVLSFGVAAIISLIICFILGMGMKSVSNKNEANEYILKNKINFTRRNDRFTHTTVTRTKIEKKSDSDNDDSESFSGSSGKF